MPEGMGYYAGVLEAQKLRSENAERLQRTKLYQLQTQKAQDDMEQEKQSRDILSTAFTSTIPSRLGQEQEEGDNALADQTTEAAKKIMGVDPKAGLDLLKAGQEFKSNAALTKYRNMQMKQAQLEQAGQIANEITDQESLDEALPELAKHGVVIPERFRVWSPQTKEWLGRRAIANDNVLKSMQIQQDNLALGLRKQENDSKQQDRIEKQKLAASKEARQRDKINQGRKLKEFPEKNVLMEVAGLSSDPSFDDLEDADKLTAARDVFSVAQTYIAEGLEQDIAMAKARETIKSRIDPESGTYKVVEDKMPKMNTKFVEGKIYTDAKGNKAKYISGKWVPQ